MACLEGRPAASLAQVPADVQSPLAQGRSWPELLMCTGVALQADIGCSGLHASQRQCAKCTVKKGIKPKSHAYVPVRNGVGPLAVHLAVRVLPSGWGINCMFFTNCF